MAKCLDTLNCGDILVVWRLDRAADFSNQIFWDPLGKRYLLLCREDYRGAGGVDELRGVRTMENANLYAFHIK